jgi:hypothetical protein
MRVALLEAARLTLRLLSLEGEGTQERHASAHRAGS